MTLVEPGWIEKLLDALDHAGIGFVITRDGPGGLERLYDNNTLQRIVGRDSAELRSMPVMSVLAPEERVRLAAMREQTRAGENPPAVIDTVIVRPDGTRVPIELGLVVHREGADAIALVFMRDMSDHRAMQARALEADRLATVGTLCAGIAHQVNNPLTSVILNLGALRRGLDRWIPDPAARTHVGSLLDVALSGTDKVARAVRELGVFADPASARSGPVDVRGVVEGAVRVASPMVESRARLDVDIEPVPMVDGDPPRLGQAVLNLILDAALSFEHADRLHNVVEVSVRPDLTWVVVEVADNGRTVEAHAAANAFEPFFPSRGAASTGIGLAVTRTIVSALGGSATLAPRKGGGAIATIRLPASPA